MKVFIVIHGENCESSSIISVHKNKINAKKVALAMKTCFDGGWQPDGKDQWINGCDFVAIREEEIKP